MTIDIIDLTQEEYSDLNAVQLAMVRTAQTKKDGILAEADERTDEVFRMLVSNNAVRSSAYAYEKERIAAEAQSKVETVKQDLLYQLAYEGLQSDGNDKGPYRYPENPNYNLTPSQRFLVVRNYYMEIEEDPGVRLQAYAMDTLARSYLGEYYQTLYELLASYVSE